MSLITSLIGPVTGILDKFIEDKDQKAKLAHEIATMSDTHAQQALLAQLEINKAEAASGSLFKGGWRPFVGWVCGIAFAYHFVLQPECIHNPEETIESCRFLAPQLGAGWQDVRGLDARRRRLRLSGVRSKRLESKQSPRI